MHIEVDGVNVTGAIALPNTGGYTVYQDVAVPAISLTAGTHLVRLVFEAAPLNIDWFSVATAPPINLFTNPSFTSGITGWTTFYAAGCSASLGAHTAAHDGDGKSAKVAIASVTSPTWDKAQVFQIKTANGSPYTR